ncbi:hypothetical protein U2150_07665 [Methanothermobacter wolfeii]|uniref:Uncharacterized protein n=1 Tax=Methanothermobacter wolfeii TaxID=145261 RepID=A0A9E7RVZ2_METWO|nr:MULTISPECIES: hypothetical protein [Methanothermobacter]NLM02294.1 hypothetical protein [Methanothermobacter wolfeii]UXH32427.1 hypothetical protein N5910_03845 [Methanothermobacter wolfeii]
MSAEPYPLLILSCTLRGSQPILYLGCYEYSLIIFYFTNHDIINPVFFRGRLLNGRIII